MKKIFALIVLLCVGAAVIAREFSLEPVTLSIPSGFEGPVRQEHQGLVVIGFAKARADSRSNTLLQVNLIDLGSRLNGLKESERGRAADKYLLDFVGGIERRRSNFQRSQPSRLTLARLPAAKLQWTGQVNGTDTIGVMYCVVVGTKVVTFHAQDLGSQPTAAMIDAMKSIEGVRLKQGR